ncbi:MAG: Fic family protein [Acidimicrobiaceae bacterium]|nr:Fic family protein [Acidimicrobiaceae bacterium]
MNNNREPKGNSRGGRFASGANPESRIELGLESSRSWPEIAYEERYLDEKDIDDYVPRGKRHSVKKPYRSTVPPEIAEIPTIELPGDVLADASEAASEIARFDAELGGEFINFTAILLRTESASSSEIENLTAGAKSVALAGIGDDRGGKNAALIVANTSAMDRALEMADHIDGASIIAMHEALLGVSRPEWTGDWRKDQVRIGGYSVHDAIFVPPHAERVPAAMADLVRFVKRTDIPTFVHAAVAHAQFETIHPFPDGNGRVGRALIHAMYRHQGLTRNVTVPVSAGILTDPKRYFQTLTDYREGNPAPIVELMTVAAFRAVENGRILAGELRTVQSEWKDKLKARAGSTAEGLSQFVMRQPAVDSALVQAQFGVSQQAADTAIGRLVDAGILAAASASRRNRRWIATDVIDALDRFAERTKRARPKG